MTLDRHPNARRKTTPHTYAPEDRSKIGRYAVEHGRIEASRHFTVPVSTVCLLKKQYLALFNHRHKDGGEIPEVTSLPTWPSAFARKH